MGTKWRDTKNSPDWTDVFATLRAIEQLHSVAVFITLTTAVYDGPSGFTTIAARRVTPMGEASVLGEPVIVLSGEWPCQDHTDYASCVYSALLTLDGQLSRKLWDQLSLPFTAEEARGQA
jgi:hypothetical protein